MKRVKFGGILEVFNSDDIVAQFILVVALEQIRERQVFVLHLINEADCFEAVP